MCFVIILLTMVLLCSMKSIAYSSIGLPFVLYCPYALQPLMIHESREQLLDEVKALMYIALKTKRSLIIPNILVGATSMMCFVT
jgi:hypothetical protein